MSVSGRQLTPATHPPQLRLDFTTFVLTQPSSSLDVVTKRLALSGVQTPTGTVPVTAVGQCLTDTFSVVNPDGPSPPVICGTNSGQHSEGQVATCNLQVANFVK